MFFANDDKESREAILMEEPNGGLGPLVAMVRTLVDMNERMNEKMKEMMNKMIHKDEVEGMINKVRQELVKEVKKELREARRPLEDSTENKVNTRSYGDVTKERKEESIMVRLKKQQESKRKSLLKKK